MQNKIKQIWADGKPVINGWLAIPSFFSAELMDNQGWDSLTIDMQHGIIGYDTMLPMLAAIQPRTTPMARVPWLEPGIIMKSLDAGCHGIICPMINTAADAEEFIKAMRYPPRGGRSFGPTRVTLREGADYAKQANEQCLAFAMIETQEALHNLDSIMETDGLDAIYIGPADLANSLGYPPRLDQEEPAVVEAIDEILSKAKEHNLRAGLHNGSASYAKKMIDKGFDLVTIMSDARLLIKGVQEELGLLRPATDARDSGGIY